MSDNILDQQRKLFNEQSNLFGTDLTGVSQEDQDYISSKMFEVGYTEENKLIEDRRKGNIKYVGKKEMYMTENLVLTEVNFEQEIKDEGDQITAIINDRVKANKVRIRGIRHSKMLVEARNNFVPNGEEEIQADMTRQASIRSFNERVSALDGTGNFDTVKNMFTSLIVKLASMSAEVNNVTLKDAEELKAIYEQTLNGAKEYAASHSIWKFKAISPWGIGRKRKNMAEDIARNLESGDIYVQIKKLVPWLDEDNRKAEPTEKEIYAERLNAQIITKDILDNDLAESAEKTEKSVNEMRKKIPLKRKEEKELSGKIEMTSSEMAKIAEEKQKAEKKMKDEIASGKKEEARISNEKIKEIDDYKALEKERDDRIKDVNKLTDNIGKKENQKKDIKADYAQRINQLKERDEYNLALAKLKENITSRILSEDVDMISFEKRRKNEIENYERSLEYTKEDLKDYLVPGWRDGITVGDILKDQNLMISILWYDWSRDHEIMTGSGIEWDMDEMDRTQKNFDVWKKDFSEAASATFLASEWLKQNKTSFGELVEKIKKTLDKNLFDYKEADEFEKIFQREEETYLFVKNTHGAEDIKDKIVLLDAQLLEQKRHLQKEIDETFEKEKLEDKVVLEKKKALDDRTAAVNAERDELLDGVDKEIAQIQVQRDELQKSLDELNVKLESMKDEYEKAMATKKGKLRDIEAKIDKAEEDGYNEIAKLDAKLAEVRKENQKSYDGKKQAEKTISDTHREIETKLDEHRRKEKRHKLRAEKLLKE